MGDYIPQEELEKFMASCNDAAAQKAAKEAAERSKIQADNVGHKLLSKMGWKEGIFSFEVLSINVLRVTPPAGADRLNLSTFGVSVFKL